MHASSSLFFLVDLFQIMAQHSVSIQGGRKDTRGTHTKTTLYIQYASKTYHVLTYIVDTTHMHTHTHTHTYTHTHTEHHGEV